MKIAIPALLTIISTFSFAKSPDEGVSNIHIGIDETIVYIAGVPAEKLYKSLDVPEKTVFDLVAGGKLKVKDNFECFMQTRHTTEELNPADYICMIKLPNKQVEKRRSN